jgi:hypothetical protein
MAITVFLCGHGSWKPDDGYFEMPQGCEMEFVVHHMKLLPTADMYRVCAGTYPAASDRTIGEFKGCTNMSWTADDPSKIQTCVDNARNNGAVKPAAVLFPNHFAAQLDGNQTVTLKDWFVTNAGMIRNTVQNHGGIHFVWNCCSHIDLKPSLMGAQIGVNAGQFDSHYEHLDLRNGIAPIGKITPL